MDVEIYLCRHGETEWTLTGQHTSISEIPLTEKGKAQARSLSQWCQHLPAKIALCSPRKRTLETCKLAGFDSNHIHLEADAQEWNYGDYEGKTSLEIEKLHPYWNLFIDGAPRGESPEQVGMRADRLLQKIKAMAQPVAVFSHGHFSRVLAARWLGLAPSAGQFFYLSVASLSILGCEHQRPVIKLWNRTY